MGVILVMRPRLLMYTLVPPSYRYFTKIWLELAKRFSEEKMFEYYGNIPVYCPGVGAYEPLGPFSFSESLIFSPTTHFLQDFHLK